MTTTDTITSCTATDGGQARDDAYRDADATITTAEFPGSAALDAVRTGNREAAQQIIAELPPSERDALAGHVEELRKLLGPTCADCGAPTELGTCTTDLFTTECRFLCAGCTTAHRTP